MKKILSLLITAAIMIASIGVANAADYDIYVSTLGSKTGAGTIDSPVDSLETALALAREKYGSVNIYMRGGNYYMNEPAVIDSSFDYPINILAYENEQPVLTGGRQIKGWKDIGGGIYGAYLRGFDYIRNVTVNGKGAQIARTETRVYSQGSYGGDQYFKQGLIVNNSDIPKGFSGKNTEITFRFKWQDFNLKVDYAIANPGNAQQTVLIFKRDEAPYQLYAWGGMYGSESNPFIIKNDKALLDNPNEFYYDKNAHMLYYIPEDGVDMNTAEVFAANEEELLIIEGTMHEKVTNVTVTGITFANTTFDKVQYEGYASAQTANYYDINNDKTALEAANCTVNSAVRVNWAEGIEFRDNKFLNIGKAALGMYEAVSNSVIEGNVFADIGHSAVIMGLPSHMTAAQYGKTNVAYKKPTWAGSQYLQFGPQSVTDDDVLTMWASNAGSAEHCWLAVDLQQAYTISEIELVPRGDASYNQPAARRNFEIQASNTPDFSTYTVLASQGGADFGISNIWKANIKGSTPYRYIRVWKTAEAVFEIRHLRVYTEDLNGLPEKEICENNIISNNYVVRAGNDISSAAGMQIYCTNTCTVSNNYLRDLPYTGISFGYGWSSPNDVVWDNVISYNRIENCMQTLYDGGALYLLGDQPNLIVEGNYFKNARYGAGGFYPDDGTSGTASEPLIFRNNVVEDVPIWAQMWTSTIQNINITGNYTNNPYKWNSGTNVRMTNNYAYIKTKEPAAVLEIKNNAGLDAAHSHLLGEVPVNEGRGYETLEDYMNENALLWETSGAYKAPLLYGLISTGSLYASVIAESGVNTSAYPAYESFAQMLAITRDVYSNYNDNTLIYDCRKNMVNAMQALIESGIFENIDVPLKSAN